MKEQTPELFSANEPEWEMRLCKNGDLQFHLVEAPNWFHRIMQRVCLGIVWIRK